MFWWNYQTIWFHQKNMDEPCVIWDNQTIWFYQKSIINLSCFKVSRSGVIFTILYIDSMLLIGIRSSTLVNKDIVD
jgi:hypothetical protein